MYCKNCGYQMADDHKVCQNCGTPRGAGNAFCEQCGNVRSVGSEFCTNCGKKFEAEQPVAAGSVNGGTTPSTPYSQQTTAQQFQSHAQQANGQYLPPKKYCRNCGAQVLNSQYICTKCGVKVGDGNSYCPHCGAQTQPGAEACMNCGQRIKSAFDVNKYFKQFADNFSAVFKQDIKTMLFENFVNFASVLVFILMLLPTVSFNLWGYSSYVFTTFQVQGFAGVLFVLALISAVLKYEPFSVKFMNDNPVLSKFYVFLTPALELIAWLVLLIGMFSLNGFGCVAHLTVIGWLLTLVVLASIADAVYLFVTKNKKA